MIWFVLDHPGASTVVATVLMWIVAAVLLWPGGGARP